MPGTWDALGGVLKFFAALAGCEGDAPVTGGLVVVFDGFVGCADGGVVRGGVAGDELAGAVEGFFVVVVAGREVSIFEGVERGARDMVGMRDWRQGNEGCGPLTIQNLPECKSSSSQCCAGGRICAHYNTSSQAVYVHTAQRAQRGSYPPAWGV